MVAMPTLRRRTAPVPAGPPQPSRAAVAVFPVLGCGMFLVPQDLVKLVRLGPAIWDEFPLSVNPLQRAADVISRRFGLTTPDLVQGTDEATTLITSSSGDGVNLIEVTCLLTPARELLATADFPGQRRMYGFEIQQLLHSPELFMPEAAQLLPAVVKHWSDSLAA